MKNNYPLRANLFLAVLLVSFSCLAADNNRLLFKTGTVTVNENLESFVQTPVNTGDVFNTRYYRIIQFYKTPSDAAKAALTEAGIVLLSYLPENAYFVSIPFNMDRSLLRNHGIRSVERIKNEYKLSQDLLHPNYPAYALSSNDTRIDLVIQYFSDIKSDDVIAVLAAKNAEVISRYDYSRLINIRIDISRIQEFASLSCMKWIEITRGPSTPDDTRARGLHRANAISSDYALGRHYDGTGVNVVLGDDGLIGPHIDFTGRLDNSNASGFGPTHGDMTGGIFVGAGNLNPVYRGMATGAFLYNYDIGPYNHILDMPVTKTTLGVRVASTSYSQNNCNVYDADAETGDQILHQNPELMWVFSCGNNGGGDCGYGAGPGWGNITGGFKSGKNVMACANLNYLDVLEASSSRGPTGDGRIKPDIAANGIDQMSTDENNTYQVGGGTSAAAPGIAGITTMLYQAYRELNGGDDPEACLLKACMLNTAQDLGNTGPDFENGWGRVNALRALMTLEENRYLSDSISQGGVNTHTINVPAFATRLRVMLYWNDVEGDPAAAKALVNDLDLTVTDPSLVQLNPYVLDPTPNAVNLSTPAVTGVDNLNNVEQVELAAPSNGTYTITVSGTGVAFGPQKYYIVYEVVNDEITVTYPLGGEKFVPGETETIRWDSFGPAGAFDLDFSSDSGNTWTSIVSGMAASARSYNWMVPATVTGVGLVKVTRAAVSSTSAYPFTIMGIVNANTITFDYVCVDSMQISWTAVPNAASYQLYKLGAKYMDPIAVSAGSTYVLTSNFNPLAEEWYSVSAIDSTGAESRRSLAVKKDPGLLNCSVAVDGSILSVYPTDSTIFSNCDNLTANAITIDIRNDGANIISNFIVAYSVNGGTVVTDTFPGPLNPGAHMFFNFASTYDFSAVGSYDLVVFLADTSDGNPFNDTLTATIQTVQGVYTVPWTEDFETFDLCPTVNNCEVTICPMSDGFFNEANGNVDDIDWRTNEGPTPTPDTGPDMDHNPGTPTGNYLYTEASGGCQSRLAQLVSPCIDLASTTNPRLNFWYHMYGADIGELHVDIYDNGVWTNDIIPAITGDQGDNWFKATVDLSPYIGNTVKFRWRGITGANTSASDIAIDDIGVSEALSIDAEVNAVTPLEGTVYSNCVDLTAVPVTIDVLNNGLDTLTNVPVYYQVNSGPVVAETFAGPLAPGATSTYTFTTPANISTAGAYTIYAWAGDTNDLNHSNDSITTNIQVIQGIFTTPWYQDFETFNLCSVMSNCELNICPLGDGFTNEENGVVDDIDWRTNQGDTPSDSTGPSMDWNPGTPGGNYVYTEASNGCFFQRAEMVTPCIDLTAGINPELSYKYHMYGNNMGELHTDIFSNGGWNNDVIPAFSGNYGDQWMTAIVSLAAYNGNVIRIRFRGITGNEYQSDMAIDDIGIYEQTSVADHHGSNGKLYVAPNPGNGFFNITMLDVTDKNLDLAVIDMQGKVAYARQFGNDAPEFRTRLDLSSLAKGIYTLRVVCGKKIYQTKLSIL